MKPLTDIWPRSGPNAGSYRPPAVGLPSVSKSVGLTTCLTDSRRMSSDVRKLKLTPFASVAKAAVATSIVPGERHSEDHFDQSQASNRTESRDARKFLLAAAQAPSCSPKAGKAKHIGVDGGMVYRGDGLAAEECERRQVVLRSLVTVSCFIALGAVMVGPS